jgi:SpoVK/Ycf46/Vps4 family AAA+-type ATPase
MVYANWGFGRKMNRGLGISALFAGESGTGKTMAAEILANELRLDLYRIDLSAVVSKWVGDTEKNLERVFAEAEDSNALLFFDECDSLFGQRGRISDARDRWANLQVNYLLQRVEEYSGVVVMATNLRKNIDEAFARRIEVVIEFPSPDAELRFRIWQRILPAHALTGEELRLVADRFAFTGGNIRNVAIDAAFRALAAERRLVTTRDVVASVAREYQKLGKPITQGDFGDAFYAWAVEDVLSPRPRD